jgi:hypothetical protein
VQPRRPSLQIIYTSAIDTTQMSFPSYHAVYSNSLLAAYDWVYGHPKIACHLGNVDPTLFLMLQLNTCHTYAYYFDYIVPDLCLILWLSSCPSNAYHQHITAVTFIYNTAMHRSSLQCSYGCRLSMLLVGNLLNYAA